MYLWTDVHIWCGNRTCTVFVLFLLRRCKNHHVPLPLTTSFFLLVWLFFYRPSFHSLLRFLQQVNYFYFRLRLITHQTRQNERIFIRKISNYDICHLLSTENPCVFPRLYEILFLLLLFLDRHLKTPNPSLLPTHDGQLRWDWSTGVVV